MNILLVLAQNWTSNLSFSINTNRPDRADFSKAVTQADLLEKLYFEMDCKERTAESKLKAILTHKFQVPDVGGIAKHLCKRTENREIIYFLSD